MTHSFGSISQIFKQLQDCLFIKSAGLFSCLLPEKTSTSFVSDPERTGFSLSVSQKKFAFFISDPERTSFLFLFPKKLSAHRQWPPLKGGLARVEHGSGGSVKPNYNRSIASLVRAYKVKAPCRTFRHHHENKFRTYDPKVTFG